MSVVFIYNLPFVNSITQLPKAIRLIYTGKRITGAIRISIVEHNISNDSESNDNVKGREPRE